MSAVLAMRDDWAAYVPSTADAPALAPERMVRWLAAYELRLAALAAGLGERECRRLGVPFTAGARRAWYASRDAWLEAPAPLSAFVERANRLALLDAAALRRVLAARALYASRGMLRRVVSGTQRRALAAAVGEQAFAALLQLGVQAPSAGGPLPEEMEESVLAASGHVLIAADGGWTLALAAKLVALTLSAAPADQNLAKGVGRTGGAWLTPAEERRLACMIPTGDTTRFLAAARLIFPEYLWLFG